MHGRAIGAGLALACVVAACGGVPDTTATFAPSADGVSLAPPPSVARPAGEGTPAPASPATPEATATDAGAGADDAAASADEPADVRIDTPDRRAPRVVVATGGVFLGRAGGVDLLHPSAAIERVGYHQSSHEGALQQEAYDTAARPLVLASRERGTGTMTAADIVADPAQPILAPVGGVVLRAGTYTLYCDTRDVYVVIAPDARPDLEVKLLHMVGLAVEQGQRVEAGTTVVAAGPRVLPFVSQVDDYTSDLPSSWPHVHLEVVDPSIPNIPSGGGCP